jgi:hypothetical protein
MSQSKWMYLAVASATVALVAAPSFVIWLLLPIGPVVLLRAACRDANCRWASGVMRVFSVATLLAALMHLAAVGPSEGGALVALAATLPYIAAMEQLAVSRAEERSP